MTSLVKDICPICGKHHGSSLGERQTLISFTAANSNFPVQYEPAVRKRLSAREAMTATKERYKETLEYLA